MDYSEAKFDEVIQKLVAAKILIPMDKLKVYHGRAGDGKEWHIDPNFNNGANNTGNNNVFNKSVLYASSQDIAEEFAIQRSRYKKNSIPEVHKIISKSKKSYIFNHNIDLLSLLDNNVITCNDLSIICGGTTSITKAIPVKFEDFNETQILASIISDSLKKKNNDCFTDNEIDIIYNHYLKISKHHNLEKDFVTDYVSAFTTRYLMCIGYWDFLIQQYLDNKNVIYINSKAYPISSKFLSATFSNLNLVGTSSTIRSATLDKIIETFILFDLEKIEDEKSSGQRLQLLLDVYGHLSDNLENFSQQKDLLNLLNHNNPEATINALLNKNIFNKYLSKDAHVWEQFTIGQHTESVLRAFEESFSTSVPENLKPFLRFVCIMHDIDKDSVIKAKQLGKNKNEILKIQSDIYKEIFNEYKIPHAYANLIWNICTKSQEYTHKYYVENDKSALNKLVDFCGDLIDNTNQKYNTSFSSNDKYGLANICRILQTCDSLSYTRIGITRDLQTNMYYYNGNDRFTSGFDIDKKRFKQDVSSTQKPN